MSIDDVIAELKEMYRADLEGTDAATTRLTKANIEYWSAELAMPREALCDRLAFHLASGFYKREFSYLFCDAVVNDIHRVFGVTEDRPELFWSVYLAFDEGEYYHPGDQNVDPVAKYTLPMIEKIVSKYGEPSAN